MAEINFDQYVERKETGSMKWDMVDQIFRGKDLLPMWVADMDFLVPKEIIEALKTRSSFGVFGYTMHSQTTDQAVVQWIDRHFRWKISPQSIIFTSGVVPTIAQIIQEFTEEGDEIIIQTPVYPPFFQLVTNFNRKLLQNPLLYQNGMYEMDFDHLESIITKQTKMLILCSPHNPVGRVWTKAELEKLAEICFKHDLLIVSDEIHADIIYEGYEHTPIASLSKEISNRTFTCLAPTKTFNLAEFHTSYVICENPALKKRFKDRLAKQFLNMTNSFGELVTEVAYTYGENWLHELRKYLKGNYEFAKNFIEEKMPQISIVKPQGTYLLWIDCSKLPFSSAERKKWLIEKARVALNHGPTFGVEGENFERMNIACPRKTLAEGLQRIYEAYQKLSEDNLL